MTPRSILLALERALPKGFKEIGLQLYGSFPATLRYGRPYKEASKFLQASQFWDDDQLKHFQLERLQQLLHHAYNNVPFYRRHYDSHGVHPTDIRTLDDLPILPCVSKDDLRNHQEAFKALNYPSTKFQYHTTGGSTGKPVGLYWEADRTVPLERAFLERQFHWVGFEIDMDKAVVLRGIPIRGRKLYEKLNFKTIRLSSYDLTEDNLELYLNIIVDFQPTAIMAYPSAAYIFARYVLQHGGHVFPDLKVILCGSENLYSWQRLTLEEAFKCRIYSWYGQSEYVALGGECEFSAEYHFYSEYGITEILREDGKHAGHGETGEIIATGFNNNAFPLIRYRTEDIATVSDRATCPCKRHYLRVKSIEGRRQEMIVGKGGNLISMTAINMHSNVFDNVHQFQFYQDLPGEITLRIVRKGSYSDVDEKNILQALREKLKDHFKIQLRYVDQITLSARGKVGFLDQRIPLQSFKSNS
jgi:phenylacetate-CoA ligase